MSGGPRGARWPRRLPTETLVFAAAAAAVLAVSVALTLRRGQADAAPHEEPRRFSGSEVVLTMPSLLPSGRLAERVRVMVVRDAAAASFYDSPATLDSVVAAWREALAEAGAEVRVVGSAQLPAAAAWARVLVVPSSPCLAITTREAIDAAGARGQGLIVTGAVGTLDAGCRRIGYGLLVALTGAARVERLEPRPMVYVTLPAGSPLTDDIPPGSRLDLHPAGQLALRYLVRDAFYSDYALQPLPASNRPLVDGALAHGTYGKARVVYWGFEIRDAVRRPWSDALRALLVRNSVRWAARIASATVEPWPQGRRAAAVLAQDVEDHFGNARYALDSLAKAGVPATFFLTSDLARRNARLARRLGAAGEVGTHSENHRLLGGTAPEAQHRRLELTQRDLTRLLGTPVLGLRPPQEQFDGATMAAWLSAGGTYLLGANDMRTVAPELLPVANDTLVLLARTGGDDFTAVREGRRDPDSTAAVLLREYRRIRALGGLYVLSYHSQLLARQELVPALTRVARTIAADSAAWPATAGAVASWWRTRADLDVRLQPRAGGRLDVVVRNRGAAPAIGAVARVDLGAPQRVLRTSAPRLPAEAGTLRLLLPPIPAHAERTVSVTFAVAAPPARARPAEVRRRRPTRMKAEQRRRWWWPFR